MLPKNDEKDDTDQTKLHEKRNHNKEVDLSFSSNAWTQLVESECEKDGTESKFDGFTDLKAMVRDTEIVERVGTRFKAFECRHGRL